jgi:DNA polymerase III subunit gamma/tau
MYQVLARKYRPRNFNDLVGQNHVSRALTSALDRGRLHHAYLFTGTRGVGKTTIARILAKCLNCETGVTSTPCEVCPTCTAVNEGRFIDLIEIDAASRTKVEDTRELLDNVPYAPTQGRFKVYLIDEVHMLSTHSFNALLKTLEEPPEHVKFLFATTDPQKLPITVISRCLQFTLRPLAVDEITSHLTHILNIEHIPAESDAIWQIAESAQGSMRDALSLTDQAIAYGQGEIQHQDVKDMLGLIDRTIIYDLILAIHQNKQARVSQLLLQFRQQALDVSMVLDQLITTLHELALLQYLPELALKYSAEINHKIMQMSGLISAPDLQLYYQIACKGRAELQLAVTQEQGFEMCILRLLAFRPLQPNEILVSAASSPTSVPQENVAIEQPATQPVQTVMDDVAPVSDAFSLEDDYGYDDDQPVIQSESEPNLFAANLDNENEQVLALDQPAIADTNSANSTEIVFDATANTDLFGLDAIPEVKTEDTLNSDDFLTVFAPEQEQSVQTPVETITSKSAFPVVEEIAKHSAVVTNASLMPKDILRVAEQDLTGDWTVEKWEYWFRNSELSPAVQELAQQGLMKGQIDAASVFVIPKQYEQMLGQLQHHLEQALKNQFSNTHFSVQFADVEGTTPYQLQHIRKEKAQVRARELVENDQTVKALMDAFDGHIENIQLKL